MNNSDIKPKSKIYRFVFLILGFFFLLLGIIGIFLPVMPTTIFILLSAWSFFRSSEKYYNWLIRNRYFGKIILNYRKYKGIDPKTRIRSMILLWGTLLVSMILINKEWAYILLTLVGIGVSWHLLALRTLSNEEILSLENEINSQSR